MDDFIPPEIQSHLDRVPTSAVTRIQKGEDVSHIGTFRALGNVVLGEGWSGLEEWGVWTDGPASTFFFKNPTFCLESLTPNMLPEVLLRIRALVGHRRTGMTARFSLGTSKTELAFVWPDNNHTLIRLPVLPQLLRNKVLKISLEIDEPLSPYELTGGESGDRRKLGIGLEAVEFHVRPMRAEKRMASIQPTRDRLALEQIPGGTSSVIAITMVYNEGVALRKWINHYGRHLGERSLLIIDDGSDDGSTDDVGLAGKLTVPRRLADDGERADFISDLQRDLLRYYDAVIYVDCDEFLIPDPRHYNNIREYVDNMKADCVRAAAFNVFHIRGEEAQMDSSRPILDQRRFGEFFIPECKPVLARVPIRYEAGFHHCDRRVLVDPSLILMHAKFADFDAAMARLYLTRNMRWSERAIRAGWGNHSRADDNVLIGTFEQMKRSIHEAGELETFDFDAFAAQVNAGATHEAPYHIQRVETVPQKIPEWLKGSV